MFLIYVQFSPASTPFQVIQDLMQAMTTYPSVHQVTLESLKIVASFLDVEYVMLLQADPQIGQLIPLRPVFSTLPDAIEAQAELETLRLPLEGSSFSAEAFRQSTTLFANQTDVRLTEINTRYKTCQIQNIISLPLRLGEEIAGVLCALNKRAGDFGPPDVGRLESLASTLAILLKNVRLSQQNEHQERRHQAVVEAAVDGFIEVNRDCDYSI